MNGAATALGLKLRLGQYHFRIWWTGCEWGNRLGGRCYLFPWNSYYRRSKAQQEVEKDG